MEASAPEMELQYETNQNYETPYQTNKTHEGCYNPTPYNEKKDVEEQNKTKNQYNPNVTLMPTNDTPNTYPPHAPLTPQPQNVSPKGPPNHQIEETQQQSSVAQTTPITPVEKKAKLQQSNMTESNANLKPSRKHETKKSIINQINSTIHKRNLNTPEPNQDKSSLQEEYGQVEQQQMKQNLTDYKGDPQTHMTNIELRTTLILEALKDITKKLGTMDARYTRLENQLNRVENLIYNGEHLEDNRIQQPEPRPTYHYNRLRYHAQQDAAYNRANQY